MEVILLENVEHVGLPGHKAKVKAGYYRNFLLPRGLAVEASEANLKMLTDKKQKLAVAAEKVLEAASELGDRLKGVTLNFVEKVSDGDRLFGSITAVDVARSLAEVGFDLPRSKIALPHPIKNVGTHQVSIRVRPDLIVPITVIIEGEGGGEEEELGYGDDYAAEDEGEHGDEAGTEPTEDSSDASQEASSGDAETAAPEAAEAEEAEAAPAEAKTEGD